MFARFRSNPLLYVTAYSPRANPECTVIQLVDEPPGSLNEGQLNANTFFPLKPNGPGSPFPYGWDVVSDRTGM